VSPTLWSPPCNPAPPSSILTVGALLETVSAPDRDPLLLGLNFTVTVSDWFGASVTFDPPLALNPDPETLTPVIVTFAFPEFVIVTFLDSLPLTTTFPKLKAVSLTFSFI